MIWQAGKYVPVYPLSKYNGSLGVNMNRRTVFQVTGKETPVRLLSISNAIPVNHNLLFISQQFDKTNENNRKLI